MTLDIDSALDAASPAMAQYMEIKAANPDCLLFYRFGDFYELFFDDAVAASRALGIALTKRGRYRGEDVPMCGVPVRTADDYLQRLIAQGFRVAVCEQLEDPKEARKRGSKSVVRRDVVRLVTPGTLTEEALLDARRANYLLAVARLKGSLEGTDSFGLAWIDISTGEFRVAETDAQGLAAEIARIEPREILLSDSLYEDADLRPVFSNQQGALTPLPRDNFDSGAAERRLARYYGVETLEGFGAFSRAELAAAGAVLAYVERTQLGERPPLSPPARESRSSVMSVDAATRANLELLRTLSGERAGSFLHAIDRTVTAAGGRVLARRIASPSTEVTLIEARLDGVERLVENAPLRARLREELAAAPDLARALGRLAVRRGGPRDLGAVREGLKSAQAVARLLALDGEPAGPAALEAIAAALTCPDPSLLGRLDAALEDELPVLKRDGGFVRASHRADLDEARALRDESRRVIAGLQARYADETGIRSVKVRHNNVLGYFVEVTASQADRLTRPPLNGRFIHRQTLAGAMRFTTTELAELEGRIASAGERALAIEAEVFDELAEAVIADAEALKAAAEALAEADVHAALAEIAVERRYVRPVIDDSLAFRIRGGRHPVVEQALARQGEAFVANDCDLTPANGQAGHVWLVTGPNMAGKSTFLRQNALMAVLAQIGAFVPAEAAHIGIVDRLFSRVGAADDLARGRSTFMVEMVETAAILNQAGPRSLVILDEIGRGTATFDGLSIAWASVEHLHEANRCRALFATHYHELTALAAKLPRLRNVTMRVKEWEGDVVFLHEVISGAADRSYGVQVAKLAGLPRAVVERARAVLARLEAGERGGPATILDDLPLFRVAPSLPAAAPDPVAAAVLKRLEAIAPDDLTPREALDLLYELKRLARSKD